MECREQLPVLIESHPYYKSLNKKIIDESIEYPFVDSTKILNRDGGISNLRAFKTQSKLDSKSSTSGTLILIPDDLILSTKSTGLSIVVTLILRSKSLIFLGPYPSIPNNVKQTNLLSIFTSGYCYS